MDQTSGTTAPGATEQRPQDGPATDTQAPQQDAAPQGDQTRAEQPPPEREQAGFRSRGQARRRARFLRRARELAYRDLGGLVYNLHRFGQRNDALVLAKLDTLNRIDNELRTIEAALGDQRPLTVLREAGITACPRCAAIHGSEDRFCPNCGLGVGRRPDAAASTEERAASPAPPPAGEHAQPPQQAAPAAAAGAPPGASGYPGAADVAPAAPAQSAQPLSRPAAPPVRAAQGGAPPPPPGSGRAPTPPAGRPPAAGEPAPGPGESTEILHPPSQRS